MPLTAEQILNAIYPGVTNSAVWLEMAEGNVDADACPDLRPQLVAYLAAHNAALAAPGRNGAPGGVTSYKEGQLAVTFGAGASNGSVFNSTSYGQQYLLLLKQCNPNALAFITTGGMA